MKMMSSRYNTMFDGHYFAESVAAARIKGYLNSIDIEITDSQMDRIRQIIFGTLLGYGAPPEFLDARFPKPKK